MSRNEAGRRGMLQEPARRLLLLALSFPGRQWPAADDAGSTHAWVLTDHLPILRPDSKRARVCVCACVAGLDPSIQSAREAAHTLVVTDAGRPSYHHRRGRGTPLQLAAGSCSCSCRCRAGLGLQVQTRVFQVSVRALRPLRCIWMHLVPDAPGSSPACPLPAQTAAMWSLWCVVYCSSRVARCQLPPSATDFTG